MRNRSESNKRSFGDVIKENWLKLVLDTVIISILVLIAIANGGIPTTGVRAVAPGILIGLLIGIFLS